MSLTDVHTGSARLIDALEQLQVCWEQTTQSWNDEALWSGVEWKTANE